MSQLHSIGASIVLAAVVATGVLSGVVGSRGGARWTDRLRYVLTAVIALEALGGAGLYLAGVRPREALHLLYGLAALALLPIAGSFASEAPPRPRAWVLTTACLVLLLLAWRLASTG